MLNQAPDDWHTTSKYQTEERQQNNQLEITGILSILEKMLNSGFDLICFFPASAVDVCLPC